MNFEEYYGDYYPLLKRAEADLLELIGSYPVGSSFSETVDNSVDCSLEESEKILSNGSAGNQSGTSSECSESELTEDTQPIMYVKSRIKSPESMVEKLKRSGLAPDVDTAMANMHDAVGVRVVCSFVDNVYQVADWLGQQDGYEVVDRKDYIAYPKPNGYRSLHLILRVESKKSAQIAGEDAQLEQGSTEETCPGRSSTGDVQLERGRVEETYSEHSGIKESLSNNDSADGLLVEVQLRTIAIDFWAALEHQIKYKHSINNERMIREELKRCADEIASVDMSMQTIRDAIRRA